MWFRLTVDCLRAVYPAVLVSSFLCALAHDGPHAMHVDCTTSTVLLLPEGPRRLGPRLASHTTLLRL